MTATRALRVGDGIDEQSDVGPVISCAARDRIAQWIDRGVQDGAVLVVDGREASGERLPAFSDSVRDGWRCHL